MEAKVAYGLTSSEVQDRIKNNKVNGNYNVKTKTIGQIIFTNVFTLFNFVNIFLAVCVFAVHSYKNMLFLGVVFWNVFIGIFQEIRSKLIIDKLSILSSFDVAVIRDGKSQKIKISDIVLDDIIVLKSGSQIPTDAILVEGECEVNESLITGESDPVFKGVGDDVLSGSFITAGEVKVKVINVGKENYVNKITGQAKYLKKPNSEMLSSIKGIIKIITIVLIPVSLLLFYNQYTTHGNDFKASVVPTVAAVIGMIPSGLVLLTSMVLAVSVVRLAKKKTLVQELFCIETLARVDILCLDKTGTITEGSMEVEGVNIFNDKYFTGDIKNLLKIYVRENGGDNETAKAFEKYANSQVLPNEIKLKELSKTNEIKVISKIPFSSDKKWGAIEIEKIGCFVVGAYEYIAGSLEKTNASIVDAIKENQMQGLRVLVIAKVDSFENKQLKNAEIIAATAITDKIRDEAFDTISYFKKQGVKLKVISGDNPMTVSHIAKKVGIDDADKYLDTSTLSDEELIRVADDYSVFGRVRPNQKLLLIKALKNAGHTVAMTGDGVNDVLALKEADCSIAMQSGSDAARNVSQIVLMDSNFASMPSVVAEGRRTINNMQRSAALYLTKTIYATILAVVFLFMNKEYPFVPIQLTLTSALTIGIPSFILAMEPNVNRVKGKFLINVLRKAIPGGLIVFCNIMIAEVYGIFKDISAEEISTLAICGLAIAAMVLLVHLCIPFNMIRELLCGLISMVFVLAITLFKGFFGFCELNIHDINLLVVVTVVSITLFEILQYIISMLMGSAPNIYNIQIARVKKKHIVIVLNEVEKKDYYDVTAQIKGMKMLENLSVVFLKECSENEKEICRCDSEDNSFENNFAGRIFKLESDEGIENEDIAAVGLMLGKKIGISGEGVSFLCETNGRSKDTKVVVCSNRDVLIEYDEDVYECHPHLLRKRKLTF